MPHILTRRVRRIPRLAGHVASLMRAVFLARQRRALRDIDDHILKDIGLTRRQAEQEAARPFWDAPDHWHE